MDVQAIIEQVTSHIGDAPESAKEFFANPAGAIESITGQQVEGEGLTQVVQGVVEKVQGGGFSDQLSGLVEGTPVADLLGNVGEGGIEGAVSAIGGALGGLFNK